MLSFKLSLSRNISLIKNPCCHPLLLANLNLEKRKKSILPRSLGDLLLCRGKGKWVGSGYFGKGQICQREMISKGAHEALREWIIFWLCIHVSCFLITVSNPVWSIKINEFICSATSQYYKDSPLWILKRKLGWLEQ